MRHAIVWILGLSLIAGMMNGCSKEKEGDAPAAGGGMATQGSTPPVIEADPAVAAQLAELNRDLKRWIVSTKQSPATFEDFVAKAKITVPAAPAGKKFAIGPKMRVILVDR